MGMDRSAIDVNDVYEYLQPQQEAMTAELERYVSIDSGSYDREGVNRVGEELSPAFEELGFTIERLPQPERGDHLVARRPGPSTGKGRLLALIHLDTVWPAGTVAENPFRIVDGRAFGPGVIDMKGGWVVLLSALRALRHFGWDELASTTVFMTSDEELGSPTARDAIEREGRNADWALVMEPARESGNLVVARGMVGAVYLEVQGVTAHTTRGSGASAIEELAHKVLELQALSDPARGVLVNVGTIEAGSARQVVPDRAKAAVDLRAPDLASAEELLRKVREIVERQYVPRTSTTMRGGATRPVFETSAGTRQLLEIARRCGLAIDMQIDGEFTRGGSDGSFTAAIGVPTLDGLGPEGANSCSRDEYIVLDSMPRRAAILAGIIANLPGMLPD